MSLGMQTNEDLPTDIPDSGQRLKANAVGVMGVVFLVVTGAAPIAAVLFNGPLAVLGSGWAAPGAFILMGIGLSIFAVGYVQMARRVNAAGGFYTFITHGLGRALGMASAVTVMFAYLMFACQQQGVSGYWISTTLDSWFGVNIPGWVLVFVAIGVTVGVSYLGIHRIAQILGVCLCAEVVVLTIFGVAVLVQGGAHGISLAPLNPINVFSNGNGAKAAFGALAPGIALFGAYFSWTGFEMAPNYAEESRNPARTIGPATYGSVIGVGILYVFVMWMFVEGYGPSNISHQIAIELGSVPGKTLPHHYGSAIYPLTDRFVGHWMTIIFELLIITSSFAAGMAFYSTASRYVFAMGRERLLPKFLGNVHSRTKGPWRANLVVGVVMVLYAAGFILSDSSTLAQLTKTSTYGALMGVFALLAIQGICCIAIIWYFSTRAKNEFHWWKTLIAPLIGLGVMIFADQQMLANRQALAGAEPLFVQAIPWVALVLFLGGLGVALYWRSSQPKKYEAIGRFAEVNVEGQIAMETGENDFAAAESKEGDGSA